MKPSRIILETAVWTACILTAGLGALWVFLARGPRWMGAGAAGANPQGEARRLIQAADEFLRQLPAPGGEGFVSAAAAMEQPLVKAIALDDRPSARLRLGAALALDGKRAESLVCQALIMIKAMPAIDPAERKPVAEQGLKLLERAKALGCRSTEMYIAQFQAAEWANLLYPALTAIREMEKELGVSAESHWLKAELAGDEEREADRLNELRASLRLNPGYRPAVEKFAIGRDTEEGRREAAEAMERALEVHPDDAELWQWLGSLELQLNDPAKAVQALENARRLAPHSESVARMLADALEQSGQAERAASPRKQLE